MLSKLEDKVKYDVVNFPVSYEDIKTFEETNNVRSMVYTTSILKNANENEANNIVIVRAF